MSRNRKTLTFYCWLCALTAAAVTAAIIGTASSTLAAEPTASAATSQEPLPELPVLVKDDFEKGAYQWEPTDKNAWKLVQPRGGETRGAQALSLFQQSKYKPKYRSPLNYTLLKNTVVGDFVLDVDVLSTARDYGHRSVCFFFGYQSAEQFYYCHLAKAKDDHANQIFIVNDAPRVKISETTTDGTPWNEGWHHVRIVRTVADGKIAVYFDDLTKPIMTATDKNFASGRVGLGSFDDTGDFENVVLRGKLVKP